MADELKPDVMPLVPPFKLPFLPLDSLDQSQRHALAFVSLGLLVLVLVLLRTYVLSFTRPSANRGKDGRSRTAVLCGPMGGGKTRVWARLVFGKESDTVTSMQPMRGTVTSSSSDGKTTVLVDTPGHPRLRANALAAAVVDADGIIFTLDTSTSLTGRGIRDAVEHLQLVLSTLVLLSTIHARTLPLLILLLNPPSSTSVKPLTSSLQIERARTALTRELSRRRALLDASSPSAAKKDLSGIDTIPSTTPPSFLSSVLATLFGSSTKKTASREAGATLPTEEGEILTRASPLGAEAVGLEGDMGWKGGVRWAVRERSLGDGDGLEEVRAWLRAL